MAKKFYASENSISDEVVKFYAPVSGLSKKVVKAYCSVNGLSKQFFGAGGNEQMFYVLSGSGFPNQSSNGPLGLLQCINRYQNTFVKVIDAGTDYTSLSTVKGIFNTLTFGEKSRFMARGYNSFWVHSGTNNQWLNKYESSETYKSFIQKTVNQSGEVNSLFFPVNRVYANNLKVTVVCKGQGNLKIGCHAVDSDGSFMNLGSGQVALSNSWDTKTVTINCNGHYIDYMSFDAGAMGDTAGDIKCVAALAVEGVKLKNCIFVPMGIATVTARVNHIIPVKKNSITLTYNEDTITINALSGNSDVYFCYEFYIQEYNSAANPHYTAYLIVYAVSEEAFTTDGNEHPNAQSPSTSQGYTYYVTDAAKYYWYLDSTPWLSTAPLCDIAPISDASGVLAYIKETLGEALIAGQIKL